MKYLIDTNAWIGFFEGSEDFGDAARVLMSNEPEKCFVSMAGIWEASIKIGIGKLKLPYDMRSDLPRLLEENGFGLLPISFEDATGAMDLPRHHGDPFDRLMAVQAVLRSMHVVSRDAIFESYGLRRIW